MNKNQIKKQVERWQFDRFVELTPECSYQEIQEREEPDFVFFYNGRSVGVELTELYWAPSIGRSPAQAQEGLRQTIATEAARKYGELNKPVLHVSIFFNNQRELKGSYKERLSSAILNIVLRNIPPIKEFREERYDWENREYFPEEIAEVHVWNLGEVGQSHFGTPNAEFIPQLTIEDVRRMIALKEEKLAAYKRNCEQVWLLINYDIGRLSTYFEHDEKVIEHTYESKFDRIYLLGHGAKRIDRLKLS